MVKFEMYRPVCGIDRMVCSICKWEMSDKLKISNGGSVLCTVLWLTRSTVGGGDFENFSD